MAMLEYLISDNGLDWDTGDVKFVQSLIKGNRPKCAVCSRASFAPLFVLYN